MGRRRKERSANSLRDLRALVLSLFACEKGSLYGPLAGTAGGRRSLKKDSNGEKGSASVLDRSLRQIFQFDEQVREGREGEKDASSFSLSILTLLTRWRTGGAFSSQVDEVEA